jgi:uncharacterized membrane protein
MPNLHPLIVHFPIVLLTIGALFDVGSVVLRKPEMEVVGKWLHLLGGMGLAIAIITGVLAGELIAPGAASSETFEMHEQLAFLVAALTASSLYWRISSKLAIPSKRRGIFLTLLLVTVIVLWLGAWHGGELVYRFGIGVHPLAR